MLIRLSATFVFYLSPYPQGCLPWISSSIKDPCDRQKPYFGNDKERCQTGCEESISGFATCEGLSRYNALSSESPVAPLQPLRNPHDRKVNCRQIVGKRSLTSSIRAFGLSIIIGDETRIVQEKRNLTNREKGKRGKPGFIF